MKKKILTIAGSDPFAGGGLQADLKTFEDHGIFGLSATTCIAVLENDEFVVHDIAPSLLEAQLKTIFENVSLDGIKIGLIHSIENIELIKHYLQKVELPIVLDPVLAFKETKNTYQLDYIKALKELFPLAEIITPNLKETELLTQMSSITTLSDLDTASKLLLQENAQNVALKGGEGFPGETAYDLLNGSEYYLLEKPKLHSANINGAGCTFASAITSNLVLGNSLKDAVIYSKEFVYHTIKNGIKINDEAGNVWSGGCQKVGGIK